MIVEVTSPTWCRQQGRRCLPLGDLQGGGDFGSLFDLENDLPDELIPNGGELGLLNSGNLVPDAASKHKQLSELLRGGSGSSINPGLGNVSASSPVQPGLGGQAPGQPSSANLASLGAMGKSPLSQGDSSAPSLPKQAASASGPAPPAPQALNPQAQKQVGLVTSSPATPQTGPGICMNAGFSQSHPGLLTSNSGHSLMSQAQPGQAQVMNGSLGAAGRGRGAGMPYPTPAMQGATSSVLAETLTQVSPQIAGHGGLNTAQAGGMTKCFPPISLSAVVVQACWDRGDPTERAAPVGGQRRCPSMLETVVLPGGTRPDCTLSVAALLFFVIFRRLYEGVADRKPAAWCGAAVCLRRCTAVRRAGGQQRVPECVFSPGELALCLEVVLLLGWRAPPMELVVQRLQGRSCGPEVCGARQERAGLQSLGHIRTDASLCGRTCLSGASLALITAVLCPLRSPG
ncbi:CREB-binding protein [Galemys pyrenaicus]|uniref:CREB-binding protein n=1 Tax=Galemys pyrenaicus TaxID=202257 RepID=A0A8J5ZUB8_GALPY|nr:CREB-binding protein [Galemys pyrenaicus]